MIEELKQLSDDEQRLMLRTPLLVAVLIAGADSEIDKKEKQEAINIAKLKMSKARPELKEYFNVVSEDFEDKLDKLIENYPADVKERNNAIILELTEVNDVLPKLERRFAISFYNSMRDIAKKIAEASGGVFGYMSVGYEESKLVGLKMLIDPAEL